MRVVVSAPRFALYQARTQSAPGAFHRLVRGGVYGEYVITLDKSARHPVASGEVGDVGWRQTRIDWCLGGELIVLAHPNDR